MARFRLSDLNPPQYEAATTVEGPVLILAGAGTGKTRVITARIAHLLDRGVAPGAILAVTFTNKAANEMRERLRGMADKTKAKEVVIGTFHALAVRILRQSIDRLGYKNNFTIYAEGDQLGLIKKVITRVSARDEKLDPGLAKNLISRAKNAGDHPAPDDESLLASVFRRYQQELKSLNAVDFDDLLTFAVQVLHEHPEVREKWRSRFRYIMVDEFQDTNRLQLDLIGLLARTPPNVCVVGDDDQSIYGWRGAEVSNILEFERHFPNPKVVKLEQNYRSTNAILSTANSLIRNNPRRRPKNLWSDHGDGEKIRLFTLPDDAKEADFVAGEIQRIALTTGARHEDFAVLYRMNAQSRLIEQNLRQRSIPYRLVGGHSFYDRREVKDLIAYGNVLLNSGDDVSLLRIINNPPRGIGATTVERALEFSVQRHLTLFQALNHPEFLADCSRAAKEALGRFHAMLDRYETKIHEPLTDPADILGELVAETGYIAELVRSCDTPEEALNRETNVRELIEALREQNKRTGDGLRGYLDRLTLDREKEDDSDKGTGVTLITLHAAKGLEFPYVFLIGLEEGLLPHERSKVEGNIDEERRLLYVGITRAMRGLSLTRCQARKRYGNTMHCHASSFIKELAVDHIEHCDHNALRNETAPPESAKSYFDQMRKMLESKP